jgi:cytochrome c oxidase subunit IV
VTGRQGTADREAGHVVPAGVYLGVFAALLALTAVTTWAAFLDLGPFGNLVALGIATLKATLVVLFFMHVRYGTRLVPLAILAGLFWLVILIALSLTDYFSRGWLGVPGR